MPMHSCVNYVERMIHCKLNIPLTFKKVFLILKNQRYIIDAWKLGWCSILIYKNDNIILVRFKKMTKIICLGMSNIKMSIKVIQLILYLTKPNNI